MLQQQQPEVLLTPQVVNFNPQVSGPFGPFGPQVPQTFLPNQGNQLTPILLPNGQQEQLGPPQDPNAPNVPQQAQNPVQVQQSSTVLSSYFVPSLHLLQGSSQSDGEMNNCFEFPLDVSTFPVPVLWISSVSQTAGMK